MRNRLNIFAAVGVAICCLQAACGREATRDVLLRGSLSNAIEEVGFSCDRALDSSDIVASGPDWRVTCGAAPGYLISVRSSDGAVCVERITTGDEGDLPSQAPEVRCTSADADAR